MAGIRGIGKVGILKPKPHKNRVKRGGGVVKGQGGLGVGLEVL